MIRNLASQNTALSWSSHKSTFHIQKGRCTDITLLWPPWCYSQEKQPAFLSHILMNCNLAIYFFGLSMLTLWNLLWSIISHPGVRQGLSFQNCWEQFQELCLPWYMVDTWVVSLFCNQFPLLSPGTVAVVTMGNAQTMNSCTMRSQDCFPIKTMILATSFPFSSTTMSH